MIKGEERTSRALMIPFLAIHAKGGEKYEPKAKGPHHHLIFNWVLKIFIGIFQISIFQIGIPPMKVSQLVYPKTLLKAKRRISFRGSSV